VDDTLFSVLDDGQGAFWVSSARGLARIRQGEFAAVDRGTVGSLNSLTFGRVDGLLSSSTSGNGNPSAIRFTDGRLMTATDKGVAVIDPVSLRVNQSPPTVVVETVLADDQPLPPGREVTVAAGSSRLEIRYTALSLIAPERLRFRYKLEGSDPRWVEAGYNRSARYTHLAPGRYTFHVLASNNDGVWNETGATLALKMLPRFYETLWFRLSVGTMLVAVLASLVWLRIRHLQQRQQELTRANLELDLRVRERTAELAETYKRLVEVSRQAGMAEVATGVLHNVGNVLNSVNVSATLVTDHVRHSKGANIAKLAALFDEHKADLAEFLTTDSRGQMIPGYLGTLAESLAGEQKTLITELEELRKNIEHIKDIVTMQQAYAGSSGVIETVSVPDLVEDALRINAGSLARHDVDTIRDYRARPVVTTDKHKVMQILINLVRNAKYACDESGRTDKQITVRTTSGDHGVQIAISDNGVGIPTDNLTRIFNHGFTTRKTGHGFGLHSGALAAREIGGSLTVQSDGPGLGATFILELPCKPTIPTHESSLR
jgi:signal transduction histidine kinase